MCSGSVDSRCWVIGSVAEQTAAIMRGFPPIPSGGVLYSVGGPMAWPPRFARHENGATVANVDSIGFVVRMCIQCSAGNV